MKSGTLVLCGWDVRTPLYSTPFFRGFLRFFSGFLRESFEEWSEKCGWIVLFGVCGAYVG